MKYCRVIVDGAPFVNEDGFIYHVPDFLTEIVCIGSMVYVPFGRNDKLKIGFVFNEEAEPQDKSHKIKEIVMVNSLTPAVSSEMIALCRFISESYACALNTILKLVTPKYMLHHAFVAFEDVATAKQLPVNSKTIYIGAKACVAGTMRLVAHEPFTEDGAKYYILAFQDNKAIEKMMKDLKRAPKQRALVQYILQNGDVDEQVLKKTFGNCKAALHALKIKGFIVENKHPSDSILHIQQFKKNLDMTVQQRIAFEGLFAQMNSGKYHKSLLNGVTGSGKTLIYENLVEEVISKHKQALILVPEIALSQHLFERLKLRFGDRIALLHSQLSERERYQIWMKTAKHTIDVILGPRSALFLPFDNLGLIIIDEEHEGSYKQSEPDPRYHAIKVAEYLAKQNQALLLLGSATPSMDTLYEVVNKKCNIFNLPERANQAALPEIHLVNMIEERRNNNHSILSHSLREAMKETLARNEQIILLINRKGYSSSVVCHECGNVIRCPRCDIPLTYYQSSEKLKCNYCEYQTPMVNVCPSCGSAFIEKRGNGTESVEQECMELFPQYTVARLDAQALENKTAREYILKAYSEHRIHILVGTQLLSKGLDFNNTTCIGVINADLTLNLPDYRSAERCFQLMVQVSGRAGRDGKKSSVYIQTYQPNHYALKDACHQNIHRFFLDEMNFRKQWLYPPYVRLCRIVVSDFSRNDVEKSMRMIYNYIVRIPICKDVIGPSYAPLSKKNNRYRMHLIIKAMKDEDVKSLMKQFRTDLHTMHLKKSTRVLIDIDPENIF